MAFWADDDLDETVQKKVESEPAPLTYLFKTPEESGKGRVMVEVENGRLGIRITKTKPPIVRLVHPDSPMAGKVKEGYVLVSVNGKDFDGLSGQDLYDHLETLGQAPTWKFVFQSNQSAKPSIFSGASGEKKVANDCAKGDVDALSKHIAKYHIDLNAVVNEKGQTLLHIAAEFNQIDCVKYIIQLADGGINVDAVDQAGMTSIEVAKQKGLTAIVECLAEERKRQSTNSLSISLPM
eukprot:c33587_g1_i1.p1 GENE.c33587_g1_i1~~c33587_g1_i1.p1  ORF type:complete len:237 (-),score=111.87 c33587_g1_i1:1-711(-)